MEVLASSIPTGEEQVNNSAINSLSPDLVVDVLSRVASSSFTDLFTSKLCCRDFRGAADQEGCILGQISMMRFPVIHQWLKSEKLREFRYRCLEMGNPEALYRQGMVEYFSLMRTELGLENLKRASEKGHVEASYVYGIILLCMGGQSSVQGLELLNAMSGSTSKSTRFAIFQECRKRIEVVIQSMWKNNNLAHRQIRSCCHENTSKLKQTWEKQREVEDDASCEACKWDKEVSLFCDMLH